MWSARSSRSDRGLARFPAGSVPSCNFPISGIGLAAQAFLDQSEMRVGEAEVVAGEGSIVGVGALHFRPIPRGRERPVPERRLAQPPLGEAKPCTMFVVDLR